MNTSHLDEQRYAIYSDPRFYDDNGNPCLTYKKARISGLFNDDASGLRLLLYFE
jgi:hypothetical protein